MKNIKLCAPPLAFTVAFAAMAQRAAGTQSQGLTSKLYNHAPALPTRNVRIKP
jgi:hypothetical protein